MSQNESATSNQPIVTRISFNALISAAEDLGYGGAYDIADRLENGSEQQYMMPIRAYTAHRLRTYRAEIKKAAASAYPSAVGLASMSQETVRNMHTGGNFLYPCMENGKFNYSRPFTGMGLVDVVRTTFFGDANPYKIGHLNISKFTSSLPSAPHELEIPVTMLAMAATAINYVLIDHVNASTTSTAASEFAGPALGNAFKAYMSILVKLRIASPQAYHKLLHGICMTATGGQAVNVHGNPTQNDILANVDWDAIANA
ncbi:hypothetical protein BC628DRAFT_1421287 [Trametes gibbosa]|nr:hypothetical protein BC628DRAFT_1421287 [Trametes gibbosa]